MDIHAPSGFLPKRIKIFDSAAASLMSLPFKARLNQWGKPTQVVEYEQIGGTLQRQELLEYPEDPTKPAYAKKS